MVEEFYACQLSAVCLCGNPKPLGNYVCAICWRQVPEELKKELTWHGFKDKTVLVKRIEAIASCRNSDYIEGMRLTRHGFPLLRTSEPMEFMRMFEPQTEIVQTEINNPQEPATLSRLPTDWEEWL
ncbi:hypothetical protein [Pedosphaera parvula]|uniref:Uncharacterized protein n=1 Tax=Pedosphaera parvula (strain Ellin514) TaxID=320771 RepID=B9XFG3_PEDPL|nr:hypothetical protein [Pedosphaera parvula]EEF61327.1 hypothetical protein Cflav_PD4348 [Pedosphaera parvula Ellin514]